MAPYRILTDSTTDLSPALVEKMNVTVLSLMFTMDGKTYRNTPDEADMPSKVFYDKVRAGSMPTTSQITPMDFKEAVGPILAGGEDVLYLAFSSGLSGTYNNSRIAFAELAEEYPQRKVICVDTLGASMGEGLLVYLACQQRDKGKSIEEVAQWVEENRLRLAHWFTVDDLNHLKRGGRPAQRHFSALCSPLSRCCMWTMRVISSPWKKFAAVARAWTPWWSTWLKRASITPIRRCSSATATARMTWNMWRSRFASGSAPQIFI
mgnify:CR=1 FL=1